MVQRDQHKREVEEFLADANRQLLEANLQDVYVTDHKPENKKFSTLSDQEDQEYYNYVRSLQEYNSKQPEGDRVSRFESGRYEKGSLLQRIFEPLAGAKTLDNGTVFYEVTEQEITKLVD